MELALELSDYYALRKDYEKVEQQHRIIYKNNPEDLRGGLGLVRLLVAIPASVIGGLIWRELGPMYVFVIPLAVDLLLRIPLLTTIPETLGTEHPCETR